MSDITLRFFDDIDADELHALTSAIDAAENGGHILIELANGGGSAFHGIACADRIEQAREAKRITFSCVIWGFACSAAALVALSCDTVAMSKNACLMYHSAWGEGGRQDAGIKMANSAQLSILSRRISNLTNDDFDGADHWLNAREALEKGIINKIIGDPGNTRPNIKIAASIYGGKTMDEEKKETCAESIEPEREEAPAAADALDLIEKIVERLDAIEHRLGVLEGEGKKEDDLSEDASARVAALYARLLKPAAKAQNAEGRSTDAKAELDDFNRRVRISDYIR